jgi:hypothetical protein
MIFQEFLQALLSIIGKPTRIIQLFAVQFRMTACGSDRLKLLPGTLRNICTSEGACASVRVDKKAVSDP